MFFLISLGLLAANVRADDLPKAALDQPEVFFDQRAAAPANPALQMDAGTPVAPPTTAPAKPHPIVAAAVPAQASASTGWHPKHDFWSTVGIAAAIGVTGAGIGALAALIGGATLAGIGWGALIGFGIGALIGVLGGIFG